jgi:hypothetical protein
MKSTQGVRPVVSLPECAVKDTPVLDAEVPMRVEGLSQLRCCFRKPKQFTPDHRKGSRNAPATNARKSPLSKGQDVLLYELQEKPWYIEDWAEHMRTKL